jgi:hypothetical protein
VTVCISAIADRHEAIVSCVDTRVSTAITSFDPLVGGKMSGAKGWTVLSSGTFSYAELLLDAFHAEMNRAVDNDPPSVHGCLQAALLTELPKFGAAKHLAPYGLDMPGFLDSRSKFTDERWNELSRLISDHSDYYDVEMIVSGWGAEQEASTSPGACIFSVDRSGVVPHSNVGFYACGSGKEIAHSILSFFNQQPHMTLAETIYHVAAAKFMSERTGGVGPITLMRVALRTGGVKDAWNGYFIQPEELREIRELWLTHDAPQIPPGAEDRIVAILAKRGKLHVTQDHMARRVQDSIERAKQADHHRSEPKQ